MKCDTRGGSGPMWNFLTSASMARSERVTRSCWRMCSSQLSTTNTSMWRRGSAVSMK